MFGVGRCNASGFGIFFKHSPEKMFFENFGCPEKDL